MTPPVLTDADYLAAAESLDCDVAAIHAVADVESGGSGFGPDGRPKVLFEGHVFYRETGGQFAASNPTLCYPKWTKEFYASNQSGEWLRVNAAMNLNRTAALRSTSWGKFQIMGFNYARCGYFSVDGFVTDMGISEAKQLNAFVEFLKSEGLDTALRDKAWATFARGYNGTQYAQNAYDTKLAAAYSKHGGT